MKSRGGGSLIAVAVSAATLIPFAGPAQASSPEAALTLDDDGSGSATPAIAAPTVEHAPAEPAVAPMPIVDSGQLAVANATLDAIDDVMRAATANGDLRDAGDRLEAAMRRLAPATRSRAADGKVVGLAPSATVVTLNPDYVEPRLRGTPGPDVLSSELRERRREQLDALFREYSSVPIGRAQLERIDRAPFAVQIDARPEASFPTADTRAGTGYSADRAAVAVRDSALSAPVTPSDVAHELQHVFNTRYDSPFSTSPVIVRGLNEVMAYAVSDAFLVQQGLRPAPRRLADIWRVVARTYLVVPGFEGIEELPNPFGAPTSPAPDLGRLIDELLTAARGLLPR